MRRPKRDVMVVVSRGQIKFRPDRDAERPAEVEVDLEEGALRLDATDSEDRLVRDDARGLGIQSLCPTLT